MADIRPQLATLLRKNAKDIKNIRKTDEIPPRVSIIDVVTAIAQCSPSNAALTFARLKNDYPDVTTNCSDVKFPDVTITMIRSPALYVHFMTGFVRFLTLYAQLELERKTFFQFFNFFQWNKYSLP